MNTAFISDLHSNLEALQVVLADIESRGVDRVVCLGDIINYGPDPAECLRIIRKMDLVLMGNHEKAVLGQPFGFNPAAVEATRWTRSVLAPGLFSNGAKWANWNFIGRLPTRHQENDVLLVHASPREPTSEYLLPSEADPVLGATEKLKSCFELVEHLCFIGHTHQPGVFLESDGFRTPDQLGGEFRVPRDEKAIVNVGSVGHPRDRDPRACYATYDGQVVTFHRLAYDAETTCAKVKAVRGLPDWCGTRLLRGE